MVTLTVAFSLSQPVVVLRAATLYDAELAADERSTAVGVPPTATSAVVYHTRVSFTRSETDANVFHAIVPVCSHSSRFVTVGTEGIGFTVTSMVEVASQEPTVVTALI